MLPSDAVPTPPPKARNIPVFDYSGLIGEEYEQKRKMRFKYFRDDVVKTTAFMDVIIELDLLDMYLDSVGKDEWTNNKEKRHFFRMLYDEICWDKVEVSEEEPRDVELKLEREREGYEVAGYLETPGPNDNEDEHGLNPLSEEAIQPDDVPNIGAKMDDQPDEHLSTTNTVASIPGVCVPVARGAIAPGPPNTLPSSSAATSNNSQSETEVFEAASPTSLAGARGAACNKAQQLDPKPITIVIERLLEAESRI